MGRLRAAIEAGRQAVAAHHDTTTRTQALLALGLPDAALVGLARERAAALVKGQGRVILISDRLPADLVTLPGIVFEHLPALADLLSAAPPPVAVDHRLRRLSIILRRWNIAECLWTGAEAEDVARQAMARTGPDRPPCVFRRDGAMPSGAKHGG